MTVAPELVDSLESRVIRKTLRVPSLVAVARREKAVASLPARVELAFAAGDIDAAVALLATAPGMLVRNLDRVLRHPDANAGRVLDTLRGVVGKVSGRVLLSLAEHLANRGHPDTARVFPNRQGRAWVTVDTRPYLDHATIDRVSDLIRAELADRVPSLGHIVVDPAVFGVAIPLTGKNVADGYGVMPRGSTSLVDGDSLRFFTYWRQESERTDFDLSVLLLDEDYGTVGQVSWTGLTGYGGAHSGDLVDAPDGASEFIDLHLPKLPGNVRFVVPQVNVYSGEDFTEVAESLFGYMTRDAAQQGMPFEPRTVRMRSELRGTGRVALPLVFSRDLTVPDRWWAKWMNLHLAGHPRFNQVEANRMTTALLAQSIVTREYLTMIYLLDLMRAKAASYTRYVPGKTRMVDPVTFIGLERPEGLPDGSQVYTLARLHELIPD